MSEKLRFKSREGHELGAKLDLPDSKQVKAYAIFAHCFTCNKDLTASRIIIRSLSAHGIAVLSFDFTGLGDSEGDFEETNFTHNINDLLDASAYLEKNYKAPKIIMGHSFGGSAALFAGAMMKHIKAVVTIASPFDPEHIKKLLGKGLQQIKSQGKAEVNIGGRPFTIQKSFLDDLDNHQAEKVAGSLKKPLLILHSPQDRIVSIENAAKIYQAAHHPKSYISLDGADHLLADKKDSQYVGNIVSTWVDRYLDHNIEKLESLKSKSQIAVQTNSGSYHTEIKAGDHYLIADEPESVGGTNRGPSPYEYLSAALASCTSMTLHMYAARKKWDLQSVIVHVDHHKDHYQDCTDCEKSKAKIDKFDRKIEIIGELDSVQREKLMEIADKCPVHKTLHEEVQVKTSLIDQ